MFQIVKELSPRCQYKMIQYKRKKVDAPELSEHEANNPDVTPSSLGGCPFSAEETLEIDDSTEDYPLSSRASNDLSK